MSSAIDNSLVTELQENFITYSIGGIFYGIYVVLAIIAAYILLQQGLRQSLARSTLFVLNLGMFVGQTGNLVALIVSELKVLQGNGETPYDPTQALEHWEVGIVIFSRMNYLLSHTIVLWRAWILYDDRLYLRILLILCGVGSIVGVSLDSAFILKEAFSNGTGQANALMKIRVLMPAMLLITNCIATTIIAFKVWEYRRSIKINLGKQTRKTGVERVLILLLESGLVYCACWIVTIISLTPGTLSFIGRNVFAAMNPNLTAIYPTLVIIFVAAQKSYTELSINVSQTLQFGVSASANIVSRRPAFEGSPSFVEPKTAGVHELEVHSDESSLNGPQHELRDHTNSSSTSISNTATHNL
ncbi:hypothetical protein J3R30DRAFT_3714248 [Lentinula aciculospora]|uniref:Uncharacterized protein n=1 Tax=Lentinula aciculospora TaxID=153920 RepID=A0A9W8ZXP3_9AGAR|nr:hypothetical protein J3R30DRAFT_3714248 [Lentinula aciculospora]